MPLPFQLPAQFPEIINFAVEHHPQGAVRGGHGLGPRLAQIDDGQAPVGQGQPAVGRGPQAGPVRTPWLHGVANLQDFFRDYRRSGVTVGKDSGNTAHLFNRNAK